MMKTALTETNIRAQKDVSTLQEICIMLTKVVEKESMSKKKYKTNMLCYKKELEDIKLENACYKQKNEYLERTVEGINKNTNSKPLDIFADDFYGSEQKKSGSYLEDKVKTLSNFNDELNNIIADRENTINIIKEHERNAKCEIVKLNDIIAVKDKIIGNLEIKIQELESRCTNVTSNDNRISVEYLEREISFYREKASSLETLLKTKQTEIENLNSNISNLEDVKNKFQNEAELIKNELTNLTRECNDKAKIIEDSQSKISELEQKNINLEKEIEVLKRDKENLTSVIEQNNQETNEQISQLKLTLDESNSSAEEKILIKNKQIEEMRNNIILLETQLEDKKFLIDKNDLDTKKKFDDYDSKIEELNSDISRLKSDVSQLNDTIIGKDKIISELTESVEYLENIKAENSELKEQLKIAEHVNQEKNTEIIKLTYDLKSEHSSIDMLEKTIESKDVSLNKVKVLISKLIKNEEAYKDSIKELHNDIHNLSNELTSIKNTNENDCLIEKLQQENMSLKTQIADIQKNSENVQKITKLQHMLEKSNELYTTLQKENALLQNNKGLPQLRLQHVLSEFHILADSESTSSSSHNDNISYGEDVKIAYLKRVIVQFFMEDGSSRESLIPIILDLLGCSKDQTSAVINHYSKSNTIFSRTSNLFSV